jgi:hypothetical protein
MSALSDDVALWALPAAKLEQYAERIAALASANQTLGAFHLQRLKDVQSGLAPTYRESLSRM